MLFVRPKITSIGLHVFSRSIHPELLEICCARSLERELYQLRIAITTTGHLITFSAGGWQVTEVCAGLHQPLPKQGELLFSELEGRNQRECSWQNKIRWTCEFAREVVDPRLFATLQQQLSRPQEFEGLVHQFAPSGRLPLGGLSYINLNSYRNHVAIRTFHTFPDTHSLVKCETRLHWDAPHLAKDQTPESFLGD